MFVEDIITNFGDRLNRRNQDALTKALAADPWTFKFISSVNNQVYSDKPLSTKQAQIVLNMVRAVRDDMIEDGFSKIELDTLLEKPRYRNEPYESTSYPNEVRFVGENKIAFRFKMNDDIVRRLKGIRPMIRESQWRLTNAPIFDGQHKMWVVGVTRDTLSAIIKIIQQFEFGFDNMVLEYLTLAENSKGRNPVFVVDDENDEIVANVCDDEITTMWVKHCLDGQPI